MYDWQNFYTSLRRISHYTFIEARAINKNRTRSIFRFIICASNWQHPIYKLPAIPIGSRRIDPRRANAIVCAAAALLRVSHWKNKLCTHIRTLLSLCVARGMSKKEAAKQIGAGGRAGLRTERYSPPHFALAWKWHRAAYTQHAKFQQRWIIYSYIIQTGMFIYVCARRDKS